ncbi:MAG TPA: hypothetical protein VL024_10675 [Castellaniella sp.]|nr:hypothetical protein [Castellaniella sp.]
MIIQRLAIGIALFTLAGISQGGEHSHVITPKPGAAVSVQLDDGGQLRLGVQTRLSLQFSASPDTVLSVEYRPESGLLLRSAATVLMHTDLQGRATDAPVVEAVADGVHYLNAFITQGGRTRAVSIRVTAGESASRARKLGGPEGPSLDSPGQPGTTSQGDPLIILPADEPGLLEPLR